MPGTRVRLCQETRRGKLSLIMPSQSLGKVPAVNDASPPPSHPHSSLPLPSPLPLLFPFPLPFSIPSPSLSSSPSPSLSSFPSVLLPSPLHTPLVSQTITGGHGVTGLELHLQVPSGAARFLQGSPLWGLGTRTRGKAGGG